MQILANALPGFRDLRGPIVSGYLWLLFGWLLVHPNVNERPANQVGAALFDAGQHVGRAGVFVAVSVAAYFIGSASQLVSERLTRRVRNIAELSPLSFLGYSGDPTAPMFLRLSGPALELLPKRQSLPKHLQDVVKKVHDEIRKEEQKAINSARQELAVPAILLVGKEPELFAEVDRLQAEGEFRLGAILPLVALIALVAVDVSPLYWIAIVPLYALLLQGARSEEDSRRTIVQAVERGIVESASVNSYKDWIRQNLSRFERLGDEIGG